jgi:hypothetical protein
MSLSRTFVFVLILGIMISPLSGIGDTPVIGKRTLLNQQVERSLVPNGADSGRS